jgi:omega-6 fatty acid desaturase (delta-12 desaturase)
LTRNEGKPYRTPGARERQREFASLVRRRLYLPLAIFTGDIVLYAIAVAGAISSSGLGAKLAFAVLAGVAVSLLGIVGHDAVHKSFTSVPWLNRVIGTVAFLPALHPYTRWEHHHNRVHHVYTAQLGVDNAYPPMTVQDYKSASAGARALYRFKRSVAGQAVYYLIDIWLPRMFLPGRADRAEFGRVDWLDLMLVQGWLIMFVGGLTTFLHIEAGQGLVSAMVDVGLFGFLIPFLIWNLIISFVTIVQHTGPDVRWIAPTGRHSTSDEKLRGTVHVVLPDPIDWLFHRVMQHPAHHIHSGIPLYFLKKAEREISMRLPNSPVVARWTPIYHWRLTRDCKLYDLEHGVWCDFALRRSTVPPGKPGVVQAF